MVRSEDYIKEKEKGERTAEVSYTAAIVRGARDDPRSTDVTRAQHALRHGRRK